MSLNCVHPPDDMSMENHGGIILTGENEKLKRKTCPSATLSTTNPTCTDLSLCGEWPATNPEPWHGLYFLSKLRKSFSLILFRNEG
jgi:hypothetical protein